MQSKTKFINPFTGAKDPREVWTELLKKSKPIDRKDLIEYVKSKQKEK